MISKNETRMYMLLSTVFCSIIVAGNLIFQKFINIKLGNVFIVEVSVGILLYPITFILSDLIAEFFGKGHANYTVRAALVCELIIFGLIYVSNNLYATPWSPVDDQVFSKVFGAYGVASIASLTACFVAQTADIYIFSWIKNLTGKRKMWLRCNVSTIIAQVVDTFVIVGLLSAFEVIPFYKFLPVVINSLVFKISTSIFLSTPIFYVCHFLIYNFLNKGYSLQK
jgi:hypothetical protein